MTGVHGLLDATMKNLEACRKKKEVVDTKWRKVTDHIVASVLTKNK